MTPEEKERKLKSQLRLAEALQLQENDLSKAAEAVTVEEQSPNIPAGFEIVGAPVVEGRDIDKITEPLKTVATAIPATIGGGLAGLAVGAGELMGVADPGAGARTVEAFEKQISLPKTEAGKAGLTAVGEGVQKIVDAFNFPISGIGAIVELVFQQGLDQAVNTIRSIQKRGAGVTAGDRILEETGNPLLATIARILPEGIAEVAGAKGVGTAVEPVKTASEVAQQVFKYQSPTKQRIAKSISEGSTDVETAPFKLETPTDVEETRIPENLQEALKVGAPRVVKDNLAVEAIRQGFDEGVIAAIKGASPTNKSKMASMVDIMRRGKENKLYAQRNRPTDVAGDALLDRFRVVRNVNNKARKELDGVSKSLKGKAVNFDNAANSFLEDLDSMGITLVRGEDGFIRADFSGSIIEDLAGPQDAINRVVKRVSKGSNLDAFELHRMKKFIDEQVTFGKSAEGLGGKTEIVLKNLRRNIDKTLDETFPEYNRVNTTYAETIRSIDALQDVAGRKLDLSGESADKAIGTLLRRLMSNAQSRVPLLDAIDEIESVAKKYSPRSNGKNVVEFGDKNIVIDDDLLTLVLFADELDSVFGPVARTSFQGQIDQALKQGVTAATTQSVAIDAGLSAAAKLGERLRGINDEGAFKAIKELLEGE